MARSAFILAIVSVLGINCVHAALTLNRPSLKSHKVSEDPLGSKKISQRSSDYCENVGDSCGIGRVCAGEGYLIRCVVPMGEGEHCGQDPYWVCQAGLDCIDGTCQHPQPADCSTTGCATGQICVGNPGDLRCVTAMDEGGACGQDPYWVCRDELDCIGGVCKSPIPEDCGTTGCPTGQVCVGNPGDLRCVTPMEEGGACGQDPYWICREGLDCDGGVCRHPVPDDCSITGCPTGEKCVGNPGDLRCVTPMDEGGDCGQDPYWICRDGLECDTGVCRHPVPDDCSVTGCPTGQVCVGSPDDLRCVTPMEEGGTCGQDPYWVCREGLVCEGGVCKHPAPADCSTTGCPTAQVCVGNPGDLRCVMPMKEGGACGQDPYWVCEAHLNCDYGICRRSY